VIVATPAHVAARLLEPVDPELAQSLGGIEHSGTAIVSLGYAREQIDHPLNGMGVVVPAIERSPILACSFSSQKYAHRAPEGKVLLRVLSI
jgi:oxygen-dependent protoporphyrinogen oxidase